MTDITVKVCGFDRVDCNGYVNLSPFADELGGGITLDAHHAFFLFCRFNSANPVYFFLLIGLVCGLPLSSIF